MGKIIKQAIFFFTRISLPAVSSTTGARFLPYHHVQQEAGFRDRTSRRCCKLCGKSKHLHTHQWEKKRILLPAVSFTTSARFSIIIICNMRRRQSPMTKPVGQGARAPIVWTVQIEGVRGREKDSSRRTHQSILPSCTHKRVKVET